MRPSLVLTLALATLLAIPAPDAARAGKKKRKNVLGPPTSVAAISGPMTVRAVNEDWRGAVGRTRTNIPIQKGSDRDGWSSSEWLRAEGESIRMRFSVQTRDALREVLPQKHLLAGVQLICERWTVQNPKKGEGIQVDFRFANYPARARAEFRTSVENLAAVERFLRFHVLAVTRADEVLTPVGAGTASVGGAPPVAVRPTGSAAGTGSAVPPPPPAPRPAAPPREKTLDLVTARVDPAVVRAGDAVQLVLTYEAAGPGGGPTTVSEVRTVSRAGTAIASFESSVDREAGTHTSSQEIRIPADAAPGYYSFEAEVSADGLSDRFSALFEVQ